MILYALLPDLTLNGVLDSYDSFSWTRRFAKANTFALSINRSRLLRPGEFFAFPSMADAMGGPAGPGAPVAVSKGHWIGIADSLDSPVINRLFMVEQIESTLDEGGKATEMMKVTGRDRSGMCADRIIRPPSLQSHDTQTGVSAETAIKHYVNDHAGPGASSDRQLPGLVIAPDQVRGPNVEKQFRFQELSAALEEIAEGSGVGYEVTFDGGDHVFDVLLGEDRTATVFFDVTFDTALRQKWLSTDLGVKTWGLVAGQGEGIARELEEVFLGDIEPAGDERREMFIDARDIEDASALASRGRARLSETVIDDAFEIDAYQLGSFRYLEHFDLADLVTVRNVDWGIELPLRIVEIASSVTPDHSQPQRSIRLGARFPTLKDRLAQAADGTPRN